MTDHIIYKYLLDFDKVDHVIPMPEGATILYVAAPNDQLAVWAHVKPDAPVVNRALAVIGTATPLPPEVTLGQHVGSATVLGGQVVAHVFDIGEVAP